VSPTLTPERRRTGARGEIELAAVESELHAVAQRILNARKDEYDEWLYRYCGELAKPDDVRRYLRYQLDHLALGRVDVRDAAVLDVGCGFGLTLVTMGLLGAAKLRGIDNYPGMVRTIEAYMPELPPELAERLEVRDGDAREMPYADGEFDVLLSLEAISHYLDVDGFLAEAARVLRPGGAFVVSDGNNGANPSVRRKTHEIWRLFESGPDGAQAHGHTVGSSYRTRRREILLRELPELPPEDAERLAERTAGMVEAEVVEAGRRFRDAGVEPTPKLGPGEVPVSPEGQVMERLFDPYELARQIEAHGFRASVHGYWGGAQGNPALRAANSALDRLSRLTIRTAPSFRIVAFRQ
jgi:SAM-dependent methyltransferase